jgi:hypothetical protein
VAEQDCRPQVQACAIRVARLDTNGVPLPGANNLYVSDAMVSLGWTSVYVNGDEIEDKNACGTVVVKHRGADSFKRGDVVLNIATPDPFLMEMLTGGDVLDEAPRPKGFAAPAIGAVVGNGVSVELWAKRLDESGDLDPDFPYAHWVYPKLKNLRVGDHTHQNGSLPQSVSGQAYENLNWFDGPAGDWPATSDRVYQWLPTTTLPTPTCEYQTLAAS